MQIFWQKIDVVETLKSFEVGESVSIPYEKIKTTAATIRSALWQARKKNRISDNMQFKITSTRGPIGVVITRLS